MRITYISLQHYITTTSVPGRTDVVQMSVDTGQNHPIQQVPYKLPDAIKQKVKAEVDSLVANGIIRRSTSPWASPIVPVKKPDSSVHLCVDYRRLNDVTIPDPFYMPTLDEVVSAIGENNVISKLDLAKGYYQVEVAEEDRAKTAFLSVRLANLSSLEHHSD